MSQTGFVDGDCDRCRSAFSYFLRAGYSYQSGEYSEAPTLVFADADYEVGDGKCGLYEDGKHANEPAIIYVRADAYLALKDALVGLLDWADLALANPQEFDSHGVKNLDGPAFDKARSVLKK